MTDHLQPHIDLALRHARSGMTVTPIQRLEIGVGQATSGTAPCLYRSMICFILQGSKDVVIHDTLLRYDSSQYLVSALDLPLSGQIHDADGGRPYVAVSLVLDPALLAEVASTMPPVRDADAPGMGIAINAMTPPLRDTLLRLLALLDTPADIPVLAPMAERELLYRLLQGPQGRLLRHIAQPEGALGRIRRAVEWIRDHQNGRLRIEALCDASGMSRASLHRHFVALTGLGSALSGIRSSFDCRRRDNCCSPATEPLRTSPSQSVTKAPHNSVANISGNSAHPRCATYVSSGRRSAAWHRPNRPSCTVISPPNPPTAPSSTPARRR